MSLELRSADSASIDALWATWKSSEQFELEATLKRVDLREFLDIVGRLRAVGLRETPQQPKLNILMPGGLRFTLVGEGVIQAYCQHGDIKRVPYTVMLKERRRGGTTDQVDIADYSVRLKLRREVKLDKRSARVFETVNRWAKTPKRFRYIKRYTFIGPEGSGLQFDLSMVRASARDSKGDYVGSENLQMADILRRPVSYEVEVEAERGDGLKTFESSRGILQGVSLLLQGYQRSYALVRQAVANEIISVIAAGTGVKERQFPGPQPATLTRPNIAPEIDASIPNIRYGNYNVTDKADGFRCLLVVGKGGKIYLVDNDFKVYGTGLVCDNDLYVGTIMDGEWVRNDKDNRAISMYFAFDIFVTAGGRNVAGLPFLAADTDIHRLAIMKETVSILEKSRQTIKDIPPNHSLMISVKKFYSTGGMPGYIFADAGSCLDAGMDKPYYTDGLIFTPNDTPLPVGGRTWDAQFKWKPPHDNTIDFLAVFEKDEEGQERIGYKYQEDIKQMVRYKTLRLFVGGNLDPSLKDPRDTILYEKPLPSAEAADDKYHPIEFQPGSPQDPQASVCYLAIDSGSADPSGSANAAMDLEAKSDVIYASRTKDPISSNCIVEMTYHPERAAGWRWEPIRVRWEKTGRFQRGDFSRTMNADWVADNIWTSIHNPVSESMIRTKDLVEEVTDAPVAPYYAPKKAAARDNFKVRGLGAFHNAYIKSDILLKRCLKKGDSLLDLATGRGGDLHKWIHSEVKWVLGADVVLENLISPKEASVYGRYLDQKIRNKDVPPMIFVQGDCARNLRDTSGIMNDLDKSIVKALYDFPGSERSVPAAEKLRGYAAKGFDVVSCMFAIHYFFTDRYAIDGFLRNIADNLKVGGFFVGCCFDGDSVYNLLRDKQDGGVITGTEKGQDIWSIKRSYGHMEEDVLPSSDASLGKAVDVYYISIGEHHREYLVSFSYLQKRMAEIGCELLLPDELASLKLQHSTSMFGESHKMTKDKAYHMSEKVKEFSFLNRWFIFRRRSNGTGLQTVVRAEPAVAPTLAPAPPATVIARVANVPAPAAMQGVPEAAPIVVEEAPADDEGGIEMMIEEEAPAEHVAPTVNRPIFKFFSGAVLKDDLKVGRKDWARYISTFTYSTLRDLDDASTTYPSLEAAFAAARFKKGTDKPDLSKMFASNGAIHQKYLKIRADEGAISDKRNFELLDEEGTAIRNALKPAEIKSLGAKYNEAKWLEAREGLMLAYIKQRYDTDAEFKRILDKVKEKNGRLVFYNGPRPSELGGIIKDDGRVDGQNKLGNLYMNVIGLKP